MTQIQLRSADSMASQVYCRLKQMMENASRIRIASKRLQTEHRNVNDNLVRW